MNIIFYRLFFRLSTLLIILLQPTLSGAQGTSLSSFNTNDKIPAKQLQEDFVILRKVLEEAHPGLYRYTDKKTLDARFDRSFKMLNKEMTEREFYKIVASIVSIIKDGHMGSRLSIESMSNLKTLPLTLRFIKGKAYVVSSVKNAITPGSEVLSINQKKMSGITRKLLDYLTADGDIETGKYWKLNRRFRLYYSLFIEQSESFNVEYYDALKRQRKRINIPSIIENETQVFTSVDDGKKPLRLEFLSGPNTALITIKTFDKGSISKADQDYKMFLEDAFQEIKEKNIQNLIIDLRYNGGGTDEYGSRLFSYLTDKPFRYFKSIETSTNKISLSRYTTADTSTRIKKMFAEDLLPVEAGRYRLKQHVDDNLQQVQQPQKNYFDGKVWVLTTGWSFSTTADFCDIAHYHRRCSFVGEEVGGGYYGNNSGPSFRLTLPNTNIRVDIPVWMYVNAVSGYPYPRRGVMPDYPVQPTIQDVLNGVDTEMKFTLKLIGQKNF